MCRKPVHARQQCSGFPSHRFFHAHTHRRTLQATGLNDHQDEAALKEKTKQPHAMQRTFVELAAPPHAKARLCESISSNKKRPAFFPSRNTGGGGASVVTKGEVWPCKAVVVRGRQNAEPKEGLSRQRETRTEKGCGQTRRSLRKRPPPFISIGPGNRTRGEGEGDVRPMCSNTALLSCITSVTSQELSGLSSSAVRVDTSKHMKHDSVKHFTSGAVVEKSAIAAVS